MKVIGKLLEVKETQQVSDTFKKRTFVLEYAENPQYPEYISFELVQDRCSLLDNSQTGQEVEVSFNLKGRKWINPEGETKYFNSLQAWRIETVAGSPAASEEQKATSAAAVEPTQEDDLPF
ncbi:MAG: DUF3127 domain-containing protein [Bacteroidota bacterium]